jgi:hypothetical protein
MGSWPSTVLLRVAVVSALALFATATITFAASKKLVATSAAPTPVTAAKVEPLVVPDVRGQAYVFAKGILEDGGFAWHVSTKNGFAANTVVTQSPAAGTRVVDNGSPTVTLTLKKNPRYAEKGTAENDSPFSGTRVQLPGAAPRASSAPKPAAAAKPAAAPAPAAPKPTAKSSTAAKPAARIPDFVVPGAPTEPQKEMPLPDRARLLGKWLDTHREPSSANVRHLLYQHEWIVTGAKFGWWHGAEALRFLIATDHRAQALWGVGSRSEAAARQALAEVEASAK